MRSIIQHKWETYGRWLFVQRCLVFLVTLGLQIALTFLYGAASKSVAERIEGDVFERASVAVLIAWTFMVAMLFMHEGRQMITNPKHYFKHDYWNYLDLSQAILSLLAIVLICMGDEAGRPVLALSVYLKWAGLLYLMQGAVDTATPLVTHACQVFHRQVLWYGWFFRC